MNQWPPASKYPIRTVRIFFRKFVEIFANECLSAASTTLVIKEKNFEVYIFYILRGSYLSAIYICRLNFCLFFIFRSGQADIVSTVFSPVSLAPVININSQISPQIFKKFEMAPMEYSVAGGTLIRENKPEVENLVSDSLKCRPLAIGMYTYF
jgi:hypothetical protein